MKITDIWHLSGRVGYKENGHHQDFLGDVRFLCFNVSFSLLRLSVRKSELIE